MLTNSTLLILWAILIFALIIKTAFYPNIEDSGVEGYSVFGNYKRYCSGCGNKNKDECAKCTNCGTCTTDDGKSSCVPGDNFGPYYRVDCADWVYSDPYERSPKNLQYPKFRNLDVYPSYSWGNLRRGQWGFRNRWSVHNADKLNCTARLNSSIKRRLAAGEM
jgi:hypothetical protein